jgi:hypothetical protein
MSTLELTADSLISAEDRQAFLDDGYFLVRQTLSPEKVARYREALVRVLKTPPDHPYARRFLEASIPGAPPTEINPYGRWAGFDLPLFHEIFFDFVFEPRIALSVAGLVGGDINLYETGCVSKVPGFPGNYRDWHQDSEYSDPQSNEFNVTVITYLDDMDGKSGVTGVVPGTHRLGPIPHVVPTEKYTSGAREVADKAKYEAKAVYQDVRAGDTIVFFGRLVHKSASNESDTDRLSLAYNFMRTDTFDLKEIARWIGAATPVVRNGRMYRPSTML